MLESTILTILNLYYYNIRYQKLTVLLPVIDSVRLLDVTCEHLDVA